MLCELSKLFTYMRNSNAISSSELRIEERDYESQRCGK